MRVLFIKKMGISFVVAAISASIAAGLVVLSTRGKSNAMTVIPATMPTLREPQSSAVPTSQPKAAGMTPQERHEYVQKIVDSLGDGQSPVENMMKLADLGPQAAEAARPMLSMAGSLQNRWELLVTLGRIGEPADEITSYLMSMQNSQDLPMSCTALALMGEKARSAEPELRRRFLVLLTEYRQGVRPNSNDFSDGVPNNAAALGSFDMAVALLAIDPKSPAAQEAMNRLLEGDPRTNWQTAESVTFTVMMNHGRPIGDPNYWYGLAITQAINAARTNQELVTPMVTVCIDSAVQDIGFAKQHTPEAERAARVQIERDAEQRAEEERQKKEKEARRLEDEAARINRDSGINIPTLPGSWNVPVEAPNYFDTMTTNNSVSRQGDRERIGRARAGVMRDFIAWTLRERTFSEWTSTEAQFNKQLFDLADNRRLAESAAKPEMQVQAAFTPWFAMQPTELAAGLEDASEIAGLLRVANNSIVTFLTDTMTDLKQRPETRGRAALALGRLGKGAAATLQTLNSVGAKDPSPTVRSIAKWATSQVQ